MHIIHHFYINLKRYSRPEKNISPGVYFINEIHDKIGCMKSEEI